MIVHYGFTHSIRWKAIHITRTSTKHLQPPELRPGVWPCGYRRIVALTTILWVLKAHGNLLFSRLLPPAPQECLAKQHGESGVVSLTHTLEDAARRPGRRTMFRRKPQHSTQAIWAYCSICAASYHTRSALIYSP